MAQGSQRVVFAALAVNVVIALFKFVAAALSRSTAMFAEAFHSLADTANQLCLLIGMRKSERPADERHPFGHAQETYFWSLMAALCIFALGGALSIDEGIRKILSRNEPEHALGDVRWAYGVLAASIALELYSLSVAVREFRHVRAGRSIRRTLRDLRDPTVLTVLFEDLAALFGLVVALGGILASRLTGSVVYDGAASIVVGLALGGVALALIRDSKSLLIGKSANEATQQTIISVVQSQPDVCALIHQRTLHLGPEEVMAALKIRFAPALDVRSLEVRINEIEAALRKALPQLRRIYVEPGFDESLGRTPTDTRERAG